MNFIPLNDYYLSVGTIGDGSKLNSFSKYNDAEGNTILNFPITSFSTLEKP